MFLYSAHWIIPIFHHFDLIRIPFRCFKDTLRYIYFPNNDISSSALKEVTRYAAMRRNQVFNLGNQESMANSCPGCLEVCKQHTWPLSNVCSGQFIFKFPGVWQSYGLNTNYYSKCWPMTLSVTMTIDLQTWVLNVIQRLVMVNICAKFLLNPHPPWMTRL